MYHRHRAKKHISLNFAIFPAESDSEAQPSMYVVAEPAAAAESYRSAEAIGSVLPWELLPTRNIATTTTRTVLDATAAYVLQE